MAHRLGRRRTPNVGLIRLCKAGLFYPLSGAGDAEVINGIRIRL